MSAPLDNGMIGKYVLVRCHDAGVHAGVLESHNGRACVLTEARRLWRWAVKQGDFLNGIALHGLTKERGGFRTALGEAVERLHLTENCEIMLCSPEGEKSIREWPVHNA